MPGDLNLTRKENVVSETDRLTPEVIEALDVLHAKAEKQYEAHRAEIERQVPRPGYVMIDAETGLFVFGERVSDLYPKFCREHGDSTNVAVISMGHL
jgi:hypothetical protein